MGAGSVLRQTLCYAAGIAVAKGIGLAMIPFVTRMLPPADYARLELLASVADVGGVLLGMGIVDTLYRFTAATDTAASRRAIAAEITGLALLLAGLFLILGQILAPLLAGLLPGGLGVTDLRLLLISLALTATIELPLAWLRLNERAFAFLCLGAGKAIVQAGLSLGALAAGWGVTGVVAAGAAVDVALVILLITLQSRSTGLTIRLARFVDLLRYGGPLVLGGVAAFVLGSCDRWFLADTVPASDLAHYALAGKFALAAALLLQPFDLWWYPRRQMILTEPGGIARSARIVGTGLALTILAATTAAVVGPLAIRLLTPPAYHAATVWLPWLAAIAAMHAACSLVNVGCYIGRTGTLPMLVTAMAALVALVGYTLLVPTLGVAGAVYATLIAQTVRLALFYILGRQRAPIPYPLARLALLAVAAVGSVALLAISPHSGVAALTVATTGVLAGLAILAVLLRLVPLPLPFPQWPQLRARFSPAAGQAGRMALGRE